MSRDAYTRRTVLAGLAGLGVSACASSPTLDLFATALSGVRDIGKPAAYPVSAAQIDALPYASLGLRVGRSAPAVVILASIEGEDLHWASADRVVLVTRHGRLVKTVGLPRDLVGTQMPTSDPLTGFGKTPGDASAARVYRFIDLRPKDDFGVAVESRFDEQGAETLRILGRDHETLRVRERITVRKWRWSTENLFWLDRESGQVWKARQQFCAEVPAITFEVLKPAAA